MGLAATYSSYGDAFVTLLGSVYVGYSATVSGSLVGGLWGVVDGFICGALIALIYNKVSGCGCC